MWSQLLIFRAFWSTQVHSGHIILGYIPQVLTSRLILIFFFSGLTIYFFFFLILKWNTYGKYFYTASKFDALIFIPLLSSWGRFLGNLTKNSQIIKHRYKNMERGNIKTKTRSILSQKSLPISTNTVCSLVKCGFFL